MNTSKEELEQHLASARDVHVSAQFSILHCIATTNGSSTVVDPPEARVRERWGNRNSTFVGEELLLNYRPERERLGFGMGVARFFQPDAVQSAVLANESEPRLEIPLPKPKTLKARLGAVVSSRRSTRQFSSAALSLSDLSTLLQHSHGVTGDLAVAPDSGVDGGIAVRAAASGGGLYPVDIFVAALNVEGLERRIYQYLPYQHGLIATRPLSREIADLFDTPDFDISTASLAVVYVYRLHKNSRKYGNSGLMFAMIEVGGIAQNLHLSRTALGLAGTCQGSYDKQQIEKEIGLDGVDSHVVHLSVVGGDGS